MSVDEYLAHVEERLQETIAARPGTAAAVGAEALAAGGKRLRPLLCFLCASPGPPRLEAGVAIELVHTASLVHDDVVDRARLRRGRKTAWAAHGGDVARATGDYLFACAFTEISRTGDPSAVALLADTALCLVRGEAMQRRQTNDPDTPIDSYLERCALKTGKLFEAACVLGGGPAFAAFGLALGVAFQIADDILDCAGEMVETGKIPGTDLRDGTPTLPLILAAREDDVVRQALAGGPMDGALLRVAASGALEQSRLVAFDYASKARAALDGFGRRDDLEALTYAVVERER